MALYYPSCATPLVSYNCSPCPPAINGKIRSIAFIKNTYTFVDPTSTTEWTTAIAAGNAVVIWQTQGNYDASTSELTGWGDIPFYNGNTIHTLVFKDPNLAENCDFYNDAKLTQDYTVAFRVGSLSNGLVFFANAPVIITPKSPVADDINSIMSWDVTVKWANATLPCGYATPANIFNRCYIV